MEERGSQIHVASWGADEAQHVPFAVSNDLLSAPPALRERMHRDGYLYLRGLLDPALLGELRADILGVCAQHGWLQPDRAVLDGIASGPPRVEGEDAYCAVYDDVQHLERFHALKHHPLISEVMGHLFDSPLVVHPLAVCRLMFPNFADYATPPHQDHPNNRGSTETYAMWIPVTTCPRSLGPIAVIEGSHRYGVLPMRSALGAGYRTVVPRPDLEALRWVSGDFAAGDVLIFHSLTVHRSLANRSADRLRVSVDYRFQGLGDPISEFVLRPHFNRLAWDDIYRTWQSSEWRYYWRDLPLCIVPHETPAADPPPPDATQPADAGTAPAAGRAGWLQRVRGRLLPSPRAS
ncbi:MAG: phytanoyl-CoA dioxygenase family protein [bacterium]